MFNNKNTLWHYKGISNKRIRYNVQKKKAIDKIQVRNT